MPTSSVPTTGAESALARQPTEFNYSQSNQFKVHLSLFPKTEWFVVRANIPSVTLGQAVQATRLIDMPLIGDKLVYDQFYFTFIVDEKLQNYMELHDWLININIVISLYKSLSDSLPNPATLVSKVLPTGRVTPSVLV